MKYIRTKEEISFAVNRLKENKKKCSVRNFFGENNHEHIDIMIDVIENERSEEWIYITFPSCDDLGEEDCHEHSKFVSAINARDYLAGNEEIEDLLYPEK